jgi:hypothetical protein
MSDCYECIYIRNLVVSSIIFIELLLCDVRVLCS